MGDAQELQLHKMEANADKETFSMEEKRFEDQIMNESIKMNKKRRYYFKVAIYVALILVGQSSATLLGRLYYEKGGKSKWMATLVQLVGFPILLPCYFFISSTKKKNNNNNITIDPNQPSFFMLTFVYVSIGILVALICYLFSFGLLYLPVSTFTLISSSQLAFNALFAYFLNSLKLTPCIINSLVLLTISSALLMFQNESSNSTNSSKKMYVIGFMCTLGASAGIGLILSLTQLAFKKVIKSQNFKVVMDMIIYQQLVATCIILVGFFASGEWNGIKKEMQEYEMGKVSYVLVLTFIAITWQVFSIGCVGLIFEVSSLFSNAISVLGMPIVPILAVVFFQDKMHGIKVISMILAIWGFISYVYQEYLDENNTKIENRDTPRATKDSSPLEVGNEGGKNRSGIIQ